ncbi:MAG: hypothetical protein ACFFHV_14540 [Promethearchaeota archaeon]
MLRMLKNNLFTLIIKEQTTEDILIAPGYGNTLDIFWIVQCQHI